MFDRTFYGGDLSMRIASLFGFWRTVVFCFVDLFFFIYSLGFACR